MIAFQSFLQSIFHPQSKTIDFRVRAGTLFNSTKSGAKNILSIMRLLDICA